MLAGTKTMNPTVWTRTKVRTTVANNWRNQSRGGKQAPPMVTTTVATNHMCAWLTYTCSCSE